MSDNWGETPGEHDASGSSSHHTGGNINVSIPGMPELTQGISTLTENLLQLQGVMAGFGQQQQRLSQGIVGTFQQVASGANTATDSIKTLFTSMMGNRPGGTSLSTILDYGLESDIGKDIIAFPMRYMQSTLGQNRQFALNVSGAMSGQQFATGIPNVSQEVHGRDVMGMYAALGKTFGQGGPGVPMGTADEITGWLQIARQAGAQVDLNQLASGNMTGGTGQNPRAPGFMQATAQIQQMYPSMPLPQIGANLGSFVANTGAQKQGAMLTGGAFSMVKSGGGIKSVDEWAESILRWLEDTRPGGKRGQGFTYEELISQQYPGSNMDAWFEMNGVPQEMREVFWNYALAKSRLNNTTTGNPMPIGGGGLAMKRLKATQPMTESSFQLASRLEGAYETREDANKGFNAFIGGAMNKVLPMAVTGKGPLAFMKYLPDPVEELLTSLMERTGAVGTALMGGIGWGGASAGIFANGADSLIESLFGSDGIFKGMPGGAGITSDMTSFLFSLMNSIADVAGDVGDVGDAWGPTGATSPNSLHPSMNAKVSAMMKANPRLKMNSGRRDEALQRKLKAQGHTNVSGKSSAHTRGLAADIGPKSEYGWLMKNASKFGLQSGAKHGEPWHVGMPGIGDTADSAATFGLGSLLGLFGGAGQDNLDATLQGGIGGLLQLLLGGFGSATTMAQTDADVEAGLKYDPEAGKKMFNAASYTTGGIYGTDTTIWDKILAAAKARAAALYGTATNTSTDTTNQGGTGSESLVGALTALGISSTGLSDGAMVALLGNKAGWTGNDLVSAVAIAGRESSYVPTAHRSDVDKALMRGDRGLYQINAGAWNDWLMAEGYIKDPLDRAIFDPWVNVQAAHGIWARAGNFGAWGFDGNTSNTSADPLNGTDVNEAMGYVKEAGLGDVDMSMPSYTPTQPMAMAGPSGPIHFNSTFNINAPSGGGNGGIDSRRLVTMLADQLESEMRRRMVRSN